MEEKTLSSKEKIEKHIKKIIFLCILNGLITTEAALQDLKLFIEICNETITLCNCIENATQAEVSQIKDDLESAKLAIEISFNIIKSKFKSLANRNFILKYILS